MLGAMCLMFMWAKFLLPGKHRGLGLKLFVDVSSQKPYWKCYIAKILRESLEE